MIRCGVECPKPIVCMLRPKRNFSSVMKSIKMFQLIFIEVIRKWFRVSSFCFYSIKICSDASPNDGDRSGIVSVPYTVYGYLTLLNRSICFLIEFRKRIIIMRWKIIEFPNSFAWRTFKQWMKPTHQLSVSNWVDFSRSIDYVWWGDLYHFNLLWI